MHAWHSAVVPRDAKLARGSIKHQGELEQSFHHLPPLPLGADPFCSPNP